MQVELPSLEEPSSEVFLRSLLQRKYQPLAESITLRTEVHGIYSIPDQWRAKVVRKPLQL
jgi:hypothetical protein